MTSYDLDVVEPDHEPRRLTVDGTLEIGRECDGLNLDDGRVSRRHLALAATDDGLVVTDLGSTNGTLVNGVRIQGPTLITASDTIELGSVVLHPVARPEPAPSPEPAPPEPVVAKPRPVLEEMAARTTDAAVIRSRPGTAGAAAVAGVARDARRARRHLAGLGSEPWGVVPSICLVDPFPDLDDPTRTVTSGTIVDGGRNEIWMVVTPESPPEPLERPLALLFGASLPAAESLGHLLEGYGLYAADGPDVDEQLRELDLPALSQAEGELGAAMSLSFVRYLVARGGRDTFLRMLASAQPGHLDAAAQQEYGAGMAALEEGWRQKLLAGAPDMKTGQFLRMTVRYLRPHKRREIEMFVYMLLGLAFTVVYPFAFKNLLDKAIPSEHYSQVLQILGVLSLAFVVTAFSSVRGAYLSAVVSGSVVLQLRQEMFTKMQHLSQGWYNQHQQGDVLSRVFSDVGMLEQGLSQTLRGGLVQILTLAVSATVLIILNFWLALIVLAGAPIIALIYKAMSKGAQTRSIAVQEETGSVLTVASENYGAQCGGQGLRPPAA